MKHQNLRDRTFGFALEIIAFCWTIPDSFVGRHIRGQLVRCGTSVGSNYRAACRGRSKPEFIAKIGTVVEESDESEFWLELLDAGKIVRTPARAKLAAEASELRAIFVASHRTAKANLRKKKREKREESDATERPPKKRREDGFSKHFPD